MKALASPTTPVMSLPFSQLDVFPYPPFVDVARVGRLDGIAPNFDFKYGRP